MVASAPAVLPPFPRGLGWMVPSVRPGVRLPAYEARWRSAMVRAVASLGVRTLRFDLGEGSVRDMGPIVKEMAEVCGGGTSTVLSLPPTRPDDRSEVLRRIRTVAGGLAGSSVHLELPAASLGTSAPFPFESSGPFASWGIDASGSVAAGELAQDRLDTSAAWVRISFHLLSEGTAGEILRWGAAHRVPVVACDPFAGGRLAGGRLLEGPASSGGAQRPTDVRTLKSEWARVLRLGFLTEGRRRRLPDAAWQFLRGHRSITGVWFEASGVGDVELIQAAERAASLSPEERSRIEAPEGASPVHGPPDSTSK